MLLEQIEDCLATKEQQIRSKTAKAASAFGFAALSLLSLWLAPTPALKLALIAIGTLLWTVLWLVTRVAFHRKEVRQLQSEIESLRGTELTSVDLKVLRCVFEPYPDRYETGEIVGKTGLSLKDVSLSLRRLKDLGHVNKNRLPKLRNGGAINPNGYWLTSSGEVILNSNEGEQKGCR